MLGDFAEISARIATRVKEWHNTDTGQPVPVPAKRLPFFKVGKDLKDLVNSSRSFAISGGDDSDDEDDDE